MGRPRRERDGVSVGRPDRNDVVECERDGSKLGDDIPADHHAWPSDTDQHSVRRYVSRRRSCVRTGLFDHGTRNFVRADSSGRNNPPTVSGSWRSSDSGLTHGDSNGDILRPIANEHSATSVQRDSGVPSGLADQRDSSPSASNGDSNTDHLAQRKTDLLMRMGDYAYQGQFNVRKALALVSESFGILAEDEARKVKKRIAALMVVARDRARRKVT